VAPINARPSYSNLGFALAANMAAELSGVTFPEFVKENVFKKLGMTHSGFVGEEPKPPSYLMPGYVFPPSKHAFSPSDSSHTS
jgi:CubicO group peptidase (beta-lactamase class C family)